MFEVLGSLLISSQGSSLSTVASTVNSSLPSFTSTSWLLSCGLPAWIHLRLSDLTSTLLLLLPLQQLPSTATLALARSVLVPVYSLTLVLRDFSNSTPLPFPLIELLFPLVTSLINFSLLFLSFSPAVPKSASSFFSSPPSFSAFNNLLSLAPSSALHYSMPFLFLSSTIYILQVIQKASRVSAFPPSLIARLLSTSLPYFGVTQADRQINSIFLDIITSTSFSESTYGGGNETEIKALSELIVWALDKETRKLRENTTNHGTDEENTTERIFSWVLHLFVKRSGKAAKFWEILATSHSFGTSLRLFYLWFQPSAPSSTSSVFLLNVISLIYIQNTKKENSRVKKLLKTQSVQNLLSLQLR